MSYQSRLERAFENVPILPLNYASRYILFSDCHRGVGTSNDNFLKNQHLYFAALKYYYQNQYTYIELGDGDELWENRSMKQIIEIHNNIFWLFKEFAKQNRLYLLYGNHDIIKSKVRYRKAHCSTYFCTSTQQNQPLFPELPFYSGLILKDIYGHQVYLTHGHQADALNSTFWRLSRFLVRYLWKPLEQFGVLDPTSAARNNTKKNKVEERLSAWANQKHDILITGHTHRPSLDGLKSHCFNTGSCVHPRCITCIEIQNRSFILVKWFMDARADRTLYVARTVLSGPIRMDEIFPPR